MLEASYLVTRLAPHHRNFGKRLTGEAGLAPWLVFGGEGQHAREGVEVRGWRAFAGGAGRR